MDYTSHLVPDKTAAVTKLKVQGSGEVAAPASSGFYVASTEEYAACMTATQTWDPWT